MVNGAMVGVLPNGSSATCVDVKSRRSDPELNITAVSAPYALAKGDDDVEVNEESDVVHGDGLAELERITSMEDAERR